MANALFLRVETYRPEKQGVPKKLNRDPSACDVLARNIYHGNCTRAGGPTSRFWISDFGFRIVNSIPNPRSAIQDRFTVTRSCGNLTRLPSYAVPRRNGISNAFIIKRTVFIVPPIRVEVNSIEYNPE